MNIHGKKKDSSISMYNDDLHRYHKMGIPRRIAALMKEGAHKGQLSYQCGGTLVSFDVVITGEIHLSAILFI